MAIGGQRGRAVALWATPAATAFAGGHLGVSVARRLPAAVLQWTVVTFGVAAAVWLAFFD